MPGVDHHVGDPAAGAGQPRRRIGQRGRVGRAGVDRGDVVRIVDVGAVSAVRGAAAGRERGDADDDAGARPGRTHAPQYRAAAGRATAVASRGRRRGKS
jgi:hypothetical protein